MQKQLMGDYFCCFMPSAHRPIFCHKDLREKVGVKVRFFIRVSQRTRTDFLSQTKHRTYLTIFYRSVIWCTRPDFLSELLCVTMTGGVPLFDYITPIFYRTEVSAHGPIFCRKQPQDKKSVGVCWALYVVFLRAFVNADINSL